MKPNGKKITVSGRWLAAVMLAASLGACSPGESVDYTPIDEIPPGPGLLSGEDGEFTLYR